MVILDPAPHPHILQAYSTVPLTPELNASFHHDFNIGSFARFGQPHTVTEIHDNASFHGLSHVDIRVALDAEGITSDVILIDDNAITNHAIWWILSRADSKAQTDFAYTITYPDEPFTLWQALMLTQHFDVEYASVKAGSPFRALLEDSQHYPPYDPHSPQLPPFTAGVDFANKSQAHWFRREVSITADYDEIEWTDDQEIIKRVFLPLKVPFFILYLVRLKPAAAIEVGLASGWALSSTTPGEGDPKPAPGMVFKFYQDFAWDSPKWGPAPVPGSAGVVKGSAVGNAIGQAALADAVACAKAALGNETVSSNGLLIPGGCGAAGGRDYADLAASTWRPAVQPVVVS